MHNTDQLLQDLKAELHKHKVNEQVYRQKIQEIHTTRTKISDQLETLTKEYDRKIKVLENKAENSKHQNQTLLKQVSLYKSEIENYQKRLLEKDRFISMILSQKKQFISSEHSKSERANDDPILIEDQNKVFKKPFKDQPIVIEKQPNGIENTKERSNDKANTKIKKQGAVFEHQSHIQPNEEQEIIPKNKSQEIIKMKEQDRQKNNIKQKVPPPPPPHRPNIQQIEIKFYKKQINKAPPPPPIKNVRKIMPTNINNAINKSAFPVENQIEIEQFVNNFDKKRQEDQSNNKKGNEFKRHHNKNVVQETFRNQFEENIDQQGEQQEEGEVEENQNMLEEHQNIVEEEQISDNNKVNHEIQFIDQNQFQTQPEIVNQSDFLNHFRTSTNSISAIKDKNILGSNQHLRFDQEDEFGQQNATENILSHFQKKTSHHHHQNQHQRQVEEPAIDFFNNLSKHEHSEVPQNFEIEQSSIDHIERDNSLASNEAPYFSDDFGYEKELTQPAPVKMNKKKAKRQNKIKLLDPSGFD